MARKTQGRKKQQFRDGGNFEDFKPDFLYEGFQQDNKPYRPGKDRAYTPAKQTVEKMEFQPGKDRMFGQNFKHSLPEKEEYTTVYNLVMSEKDYLKVTNLIGDRSFRQEYELHVLDFLEDCFLVSNNWDRFENDLKSLSNRFKNALFRVECFGEDLMDDIWVAYALNGKYYDDNVEIVYPDFDATRLLDL